MIISKQTLAEQDLIDIWLYTFSEWGEVQANRYLQEIEAGLILIKDNPEIGTDCGFIRKGYKRFIIGHHLIFYKKTHDNSLDIVRVLHENMDVSENL